MLAYKAKNGFTIIETLIVISMIIILFVTFYPEFKQMTNSNENPCEKMLTLHEQIAEDIQTLFETFEIQDNAEQYKKLEEFKVSKAGEIFFNDFCPAFIGCENPPEIYEKHKLQLTAYCKGELPEDHNMLKHQEAGPASSAN